MRLSQTNEGLVPEIAPEYVQFDWGGDMFRDSPEWGSSAVLLAWYAYRWYGDKSFLVSNYPMMKRYMTYLEGKANENILYQGLSDWYDIGPERPGVSQLTPAGITATAIYYYDLEKMVAIADILGFAEDKSYYDSLKNEAKTSFNTTFYNKEKGWYGTGSQTAQAMALYMGLTDGGVREQVMDHLIEDIVQRDTSFTAGDIGHRYLIQTLAQQGENDLIYAMHRDDTRPGYGYQIKKGATALTESWAALPNVSNNHLMLGHLMEWLYAGIGGIRQDESSVAYKSIVIEPILMDHIERAVVSFQSPYGRIAMSRYTKDGAQKIEVDIPANTSARIVLPRARYQVDDDLAKIGEFEENGHMKTFIEVGSGKYSIDKIH